MYRRIYDQWVYKIFNLVCVLSFQRHLSNILTKRVMEKPFYREIYYLHNFLRTGNVKEKLLYNRAVKLLKKIYMNTFVKTLKLKK